MLYECGRGSLTSGLGKQKKYYCFRVVEWEETLSEVFPLCLCSQFCLAL